MQIRLRRDYMLGLLDNKIINFTFIILLENIWLVQSSVARGTFSLATAMLYAVSQSL
ncbi:hypothetical protein EMIT0P253_30298 [Pseudomonas sp. IT-P253]